MQKTMLSGLIILLFLGACTPSSPTGMAVLDENNATNETKTLKYTIPDELINATQTCLDQINELKEQKVKDEYALLQAKGDQQKFSIELQFKKDNKKLTQEAEEIAKKLQEASNKAKELKADIEAKKNAIRLLEEKCHLKKK